MNIERIIKLCEEACEPLREIDNGTTVTTYYRPERKFALKILELIKGYDKCSDCAWFREYDGEMKCWVNMPDSINDCRSDCENRWVED